MLTFLCLGLIYGYSIFVTPLEAEFGWSRSETSLTFTISVIAMCLGIMLGGQLNKTRDKPALTLAAAAVLIAAGFGIASTTQAIFTFYAAYGVGVGFGVGFAYSELISVGSRLIPGRQGMLSGVLLMCFGLGAMVLGAVCSRTMEQVGWRQTFLALGVLLGVLLVITGFYLQTVSSGRKAQKAASGAEEGFTAREMVAASEFKLLYLWLILLSAAGLALMGHIAPCAMQIGAGAGTAAFLAGLTSVSNGLGRLVYGMSYDKLGSRKTIGIISAVFLIAAAVTAVAVTMESIGVLGAGCVLIGMSFGASPTSSSAVTAKFYGPRYFSGNFGITSTTLIPAAFLGPYLAGWLYTSSGAYQTTFYAVAGFAAVATLAGVLLLRAAAKNGRPL
ncbi:MAG: MFS transporter [Bacillota bacterium]|nr:MFS transporter [Bacillota bacterium]